MTLPNSGALSFSELQTEFSGVHPISLSEYYKSGGNGYVPSTVPIEVTASNLGGSNSANARYPQIGGYDPQINTFGRLYTQALWGDNGSNITMDRNFTVNKTGTYQYRASYFIQNATKTATVTFYVNGSQVRSHSLTASSNQTTSATNTLSVSAGQVIRVVGSGGSAGWANITIYVGGSSFNNDDIDFPVNANIPTSGDLSLSDFYGGRAS